MVFATIKYSRNSSAMGCSPWLAVCQETQKTTDMNPENRRAILAMTKKRFRKGQTGVELLSAVKTDIKETWPTATVPPFVVRQIVDDVLHVYGYEMV
jgi:hypothetical protein